MPDPAAEWSLPARTDGAWRRFGASLPMRTALLAVATVWLLGAVWSFQEQTAFASAKGFSFPHLLPLVIDGFAIAMAGVAWAASLDARPAIPARLATVAAVAASSTSNGAWAYLRTDHDLATVVLGVAVPITANLAFEVLLAELRRQVQRRRGLPPPVAIPYPRLVRLVLAPLQTVSAWRVLVLQLTDMEHSVAPMAASFARASTPADAEPEAVQATTTGAATEGPEPSITGQYQSLAAAPAPARALSHPEPVETAAQPAPPAAPSAPPERPARPPGATSARGPKPRGASSPGPVAGPSAQHRRRDLEAAPAARPRRSSASANGAPTEARPSGSRPIDPRVKLLAQHLATTKDAGEFTGEMVGPLLDIDVAPRTGRRLLGLARELVSQRAKAEADGRDPELSFIGSR